MPSLECFIPLMKRVSRPRAFFLVTVITATLLTRGISADEPNEVLTMKSFISSDLFNEFLSSFNPENKPLEIFVPQQCLVQNAAMFKTFVNSLTYTVTLWTDGILQHTLCYMKICCRFKKTYLPILYFVCNDFALKDLLRSLYSIYYMRAFIIAEGVTLEPLLGGIYKRPPFMPEFSGASGTFKLTLFNGSVHIQDEFRLQSLRILLNDLKNLRFCGTQSLCRAGYKRSCTKRGKYGRSCLPKQLPLNGSHILITREKTFPAEYPNLDVTTELLKHRLAHVKLSEFKATLEGQLFSSGTLFLSEYRTQKSARRDLVAQYINQVGYAFFVPRAERVLKEFVFFLPFSWNVWIALLISLVAFLAAIILINNFFFNDAPDMFTFLTPILASLLQQGVHFRSAILGTQSSRLALGTILLSLFIMSTIFKSRITSLLTSLPFQSKPLQFISVDDAVQKKYRICGLNYLHVLQIVNPDDHKGLIRYADFLKGGSECFVVSKNGSNSMVIKIGSDKKDLFLIPTLDTERLEALRRQFLGKGYVEAEELVLTYLMGPEIRRSSVFFDDVKDTLTRGVEAGLYARSASKGISKSPYRREGSVGPASEIVLKLSDLRPIFVIWCVGMVLGLLVLFGELNFYRSEYNRFRNLMSLLFPDISLLCHGAHGAEAPSE